MNDLEINVKNKLLYFKKILNNFNYNLDTTLNKKDNEIIDDIKTHKQKNKKNIKKEISLNIYLKSDLNNFFSLLKLLSVDNVRIVCHNNVMFEFFNNINDKDLLSNVKIISKNQNIWSFFFKYDNKNIFVTRHAYSISNFFKSKKQKFKQLFENDPSLTLWGILTSLYRSHILHKEEKNYIIDNKSNEINNIYVSILIRTWMSAVCLYLQYSSNNSFNLIISPFLKEDGFTVDNFPNTLKKQISNFLLFLNNLKYIHNTLKTVQINQNSYLKKIIKNLDKIMIFFLNKNKIIIKHPNKNFTIIFSNNNFKVIENNEIYYNLEIYQGVNIPTEDIISQLDINYEKTNL